MSLIFEKKITVTEKHIDANNHVNNVQYVHWVEEIAGEHWAFVKHKTQYPDDIWMLLDHHIQYKKQVFLGDILIIRTYPDHQKESDSPARWNSTAMISWW